MGIRQNRHRVILWTMSSVKIKKLWDIFCQVIDNYGDIGVCWRLAVGLAARGERVRLWVDDPSALVWMAPGGAPGVEVKVWTQPLQTQNLVIGDVLVEAFGCDVPSELVALYADKKAATDHPFTWINLEYLSAEGFVARSHGLPSPVMHGPGAGLTKHFFYPGFTAETGGLLREPDLIARQARFDRRAWLKEKNIDFQGERLISMFCYEPPALNALLDQLAADERPTRLLVTAGRATVAVKACIDAKNSVKSAWNGRQSLLLSYLPTLTQCDFDRLLWSCDLNFVRGEDSLVRALWANKPFIWQIYQQHDDAQYGKLEAFLKVLNAPPSLRTFHHVWNGMSQDNLPMLALPQWQQTASQMRDQQQQHADQVTQLISFVSKKH